MTKTETPPQDETIEVTPLAELEKLECLKALRRTGGRVRDAAKLLGISRATLYRKLEIWGLFAKAG